MNSGKSDKSFKLNYFFKVIAKKEETKMKRLLLAMCLVIVVAFAFYGTANAIGGVCSNCHTMHNSQDGADVVVGGPNNVLLKSSTECLGCHTGAGVPGAPLVDKAVGTMLSGGSFADSVVGTSESKTHNVSDLAAGTFNAGDPDLNQATLNKAPGGVTLTSQLKCGGTNGCHGSHDAKVTSTDGLKGFHHAPKTTYKFLQIATGNTGAGTDVIGLTSTTYEATGGTAADHNVYGAGATGISMFCNNCHDKFHGTAADESGGSASPWKRHPTDFTLTAAMASATISYSTTPFAFTSGDIAGMSTTTTTGYTATLGQVMCLSCHRAHASQYDDMLRFDYTTMNAGGGGTTGCLACHVNQR